MTWMNGTTPVPRSQFSFTDTGFYFSTLDSIVRKGGCVKAMRIDGNGSRCDITVQLTVYVMP